MKAQGTLLQNIEFDSFTLFSKCKDPGLAFFQLLGGSVLKDYLVKYRTEIIECKRNIVINQHKTLAALTKNTALCKDYAYILGLRSRYAVVVEKDFGIDMDMYQDLLLANCNLLIRSDLVYRKGNKLYLWPEV